VSSMTFEETWATGVLLIESASFAFSLIVYSLYLKVFLLSMPLQSFYKNTAAALPIVMQMYECVTAYLEEFSE